MTSSPPRVTFDTNVCNVIHHPAKWPKLVAPEDARKIRAAIVDGRIVGFVSEGSLFVECLSFSGKLAYLAVAGMSGERPTPDPRGVTRFADLAKIGMKLLHAPLIGGETFVDSFEWAKDEVFSAADRHERFCNFVRPLAGKQKLQNCGEALEEKYPQRFGNTEVRGPTTWLKAFKRAWDSNAAGRKALEKSVRPLLGEWCDGLILGSHVGYGNDVFCTTDLGGNAGSRSLLHLSNRTNLIAQGITLMSPAELVKKYSL